MTQRIERLKHNVRQWKRSDPLLTDAEIRRDLLSLGCTRDEIETIMAYVNGKLRLRL